MEVFMNDIPGYFDQREIAHQTGFYEGQNIGEQAGFVKGRQTGLREGQKQGYDRGYSVGWDQAVDQANEQMLQQMAHTRQHIAEKEELAKQLREQALLILKLKTLLEETDRENSNLKKSNEGLHQVVTALKDANERLQAQAVQLNEKYKTRTQEFSDHIWQYNRSMVFMSSVRSTLEELTAIHSAQARQVREVFAQKYGDSVKKALAEGAIKVAPEKDEEFKKNMPNTQKFILDMLNNVAPIAQPKRERMVAHVPIKTTEPPEDEHTLGM